MANTSITVSHATLCDLNELKALMSREEGRTVSQDEILQVILHEVLAAYRRRARSAPA